MKDFIENELKVDDFVAFARNPYADLMVGKIVGFSPKGIKIIAQDKDGKWCDYKYQKFKYEIVYPYQCVRINYNE